MTRFALCTAVHTEAAKRIMQTDDLELAAAVGFAFARLYAILKNARRGGGQEKPKPKFVPSAHAHNEQQEGNLQAYNLGKIEFRVDPQVKKAWVKLGDGWVEGLGWKGLSEIAKVPENVRQLVENLPDEALASERKVFEFYRSLRDELGL
jgi:pyruvate/2-oxoacid:ferredoxin oxidoreductase beta subunit